MKTVLFNIHDVALIVAVVACALLGSRHIAGCRRPKRSGYLFGLFLAANALVAINTLILWAEPIRHPVFAALPYLYLFLGVASFLLGPLLYWQLKAHMNPAFRLEARQYLHLVPVILALVYLYLECFRFPHVVQRDLLLNLRLYQQPGAFYGDFMTLKKLLPVIYGGLCLWLVQRQPGDSDAVGGAIRKEQRYVAGGFTLIWLWAAITHFYGTVHPGDISDVMGIVGNYLNLGLIALLLYRESSQASLVPRSGTRKRKAPTDEQPVAKITEAMARDKAFLNPQLTLERFATMVAFSPRDVSAVINRRFHQNFHEFVSRYRLEEVKTNLRDPCYNDWTVTEIAQAAGFNSKATFHRLFKKTEGTTPTRYRRDHQAAARILPTSSQTA